MSEVFEYVLQWEQNIGHGRGTLMQINTTDHETGQHVWRRCCKNRALNDVRDVRAICNGEAFDPAGMWPRPCAVLAEQ